MAANGRLAEHPGMAGVSRSSSADANAANQSTCISRDWVLAGIYESVLTQFTTLLPIHGGVSCTLQKMMAWFLLRASSAT